MTTPNVNKVRRQLIAEGKQARSELDNSNAWFKVAEPTEQPELRSYCRKGHSLANVLLVHAERIDTLLNELTIEAGNAEQILHEELNLTHEHDEYATLVYNLAKHVC